MLDAIVKARHPLALTGAGISAPSGIPTFDMPYRGRPVRNFLGRDYYHRDPYGFFELFCLMEGWCHAEPNAAHRALADHGVRVVTQNIDGLHQRAGSVSDDVIELHGSLRTVLCPACGRTSSAEALCETLRPLYAQSDQASVLSVLRCPCGAMLDMDVVLYGDAVRGFERAVDWLMQADLLLIIGTLLEVYPAAALPQIARERGVFTLMENQDCIAALAGPEEPA